MDIRTQSALLASIVCSALGLSMLLRAGRPRVFTAYSVLALVVGGYYLSQFADALLSPLSGFPWSARIALGTRLILGALVPSAALGFFLEFLRVSPNTARRGRNVALLSALLGFAVGPTPLASNPWVRVALAVWVFAALSVPISLLTRRMRQSDSRIERLRLRYLAIGAGGTLALTALDVLAERLGFRLPTLGPLVATLYLFFLAQTLLKLRLMDLQELFGKVASHTVLAAVLAAVFATLTAWVSGNASLFLFNTVVAAFVILILLEPLREKIDERVVALFFRERFELIRSLSQLRTRMANVIEVRDLANLVLDALIETRRVTHASAYLLAEDRPGFRLLDARGPQPVAFLDIAAARGLLNAAAGGQKVFLLENLDRRLAELRIASSEARRVRDELRRSNETRAALTQMKAGICVPLLGNDRVIGFLNLWDERVPEAYASDEINLIQDVAEQFATVIENSKIYDRMRERDRLAALGEMAAGLAHEIRNPLGAIKGAAQCLDPKRLPGEDGEFLEVIVEEVNRLNGVVSAFLDYARPLKQNFGATDLNEVVSRTIKLIQNEIPSGIETSVELAGDLPKVEGDAEQLKQVLINLVQNAIQAMGSAPGRIQVVTRRGDRFNDLRGRADAVEVRVQDSGPGIPQDQQPHIFVPFFTTKEKGTGLGLAICQRIVKNHGGSISVESSAHEGTAFIIRLPIPVASSTVEGFPPLDGTPYPGSLTPEVEPPAPAIDTSSAPSAKRPSRRERKKAQAVKE